MAQAHEVEFAILACLEHKGPCALDDLVRTFPLYTWNQVFSAIDRLSRQGTVVIQRKDRFEYVAIRTAKAFKPSTPDGPQPSATPAQPTTERIKEH